MLQLWNLPHDVEIGLWKGWPDDDVEAGLWEGHKLQTDQKYNLYFGGLE